MWGADERTEWYSGHGYGEMIYEPKSLNLHMYVGYVVNRVK